MNSTAEQTAKLGVVNHAAMLMDQLRLLGRAIERDDDFHNYNQRLGETLGRQTFGSDWTARPAETTKQESNTTMASDDMNISVDSPVTTNHYYPAPATSDPSRNSGPTTAAGLLPKMALAAGLALASGLGGAGLMALLNLRAATPPAVSSAPAPTPQLGKDYQIGINVLPAQNAKDNP